MLPMRAANPRSLLAAATAAAISLAISVPAAAGAAGTDAPTAPTAAKSTTGDTTESGRTPEIAAASDGRRLYVRTGMTIDQSKETRFRDGSCAAPRPGHFYGCGPGVDGAPYSSLGDFGTMVGFEVGIGYVASPALRMEAGVQYRPGFSFEGHHNYSRRLPRSVSADLSSLSATVAGYLDLPALGRTRFGPSRPFVGAGIGLARIDIDEMHLNFRRTVVTLPGDDRINLAWMLTAGVAVPVGEVATLDLAWRYTDFGTVETGRGTGRTVCRIEGCGLASEYAVPETLADLASHGLYISLRFAF